MSAVRHLVDDGRPSEAVDLLAGVTRVDPAPELLIRLRDLRGLAAELIPSTEGRSTWPPAYRDPFPDVAGEIPEVHADELSVDVLGGAVLHHGALLVRGLLDAQQAAGIREATQRAQDHQLDPTASPDEWFNPVHTGRRQDVVLRAIVRGQGATWLADSPTTTALVLEVLESAGLAKIVHEHFGERPVFSLQKSTLRCVQPEPRMTGWHQDGSFLDPDVRTMNVWVALSDCGGDNPASGLEILPARVEEILPVGLGGDGPVTIPFQVVDDLAVVTPTVRPRFAPGDALLFDEHLLHRTWLGPGLSEPRYALECWLFAPSHTTAAYTPFVV